MNALMDRDHSPIKKLRNVERALKALPSQHKRVLDALYGNYVFPPQIVSIFDIRAGAALFNTHATTTNALTKLCSKKLSKHIDIDDLAQLTKIVNETKTIYEQAHSAYLNERNK
mgnify:CR=1 FL=1